MVRNKPDRFYDTHDMFDMSMIVTSQTCENNGKDGSKDHALGGG